MIIALINLYSNINKEIIIFGLYKMASNESSGSFAEYSDSNSFPFSSGNFNVDSYGSSSIQNNS